MKEFIKDVFKEKLTVQEVVTIGVIVIGLFALIGSILNRNVQETLLMIGAICLLVTIFISNRLFQEQEKLIKRLLKFCDELVAENIALRGALIKNKFQKEHN